MAIKDRNGALHSEKIGQFVSNGEGESSGFDVEKLKREPRGHLSTIIPGRGEPLNISLDFFSESKLDKDASKSLRRGIRRIKKNLELHRLKIKHPEKYSKDWDSLSESLKEKRIEYWKKEINEKIEAIQRRKNILRERGEDDE